MRQSRISYLVRDISFLPAENNIVFSAGILTHLKVCNQLRHFQALKVSFFAKKRWETTSLRSVSHRVSVTFVFNYMYFVTDSGALAASAETRTTTFASPAILFMSARTSPSLSRSSPVILSAPSTKTEVMS